MIGFIYIMSNPAHPGLLKIGQTSKDPNVRRRELNSTGVPEDFVLEYRVLAEDYQRLEKEIHQKLKKYRLRTDKEFFEIAVEKAISILREVAGDRIEYEKIFYVSPEEVERVKEDKKQEKINQERQVKLEAKKQNKRIERERNRKARNDAFLRLGDRIWKFIKFSIILGLILLFFAFFSF